MSLLPPNASQTDIAVANLFLNKLDIDNSNISILPLTAKAEILPHLAVMFDVDISNLEDSEARTYIHNALEIHKYKGTVYAVKKAINTVFEIAELVEWFDRDLAAGLFDVDISVTTDLSITYGLDKFEKAKRLINNAKNVRSHLNYFTLKLPVGAGNLNYTTYSITDLQLSNEITLKQSTANFFLMGSTASNINLSKEIKPFISLGKFRDSGASVSDINLSKEIKPFISLGKFRDSGASVSDINLSNNSNLLADTNGKINIAFGGVIDVSIKNESNFKNESEVNLKIIGGVTWNI